MRQVAVEHVLTPGSKSRSEKMVRRNMSLEQLCSVVGACERTERSHVKDKTAFAGDINHDNLRSHTMYTEGKSTFETDRGVSVEI